MTMRKAAPRHGLPVIQPPSCPHPLAAIVQKMTTTTMMMIPPSHPSRSPTAILRTLPTWFWIKSCSLTRAQRRPATARKTRTTTQWTPPTRTRRNLLFQRLKLLRFHKLSGNSKLLSRFRLPRLPRCFHRYRLPRRLGHPAQPTKPFWQ